MSNNGPSQLEKNNLINLLKEGTRKVFGDANKMISDAFLGCKEKPPISSATYRIFISQLYYIYDTLERGLRNNDDDDIVGPIYFPQLNRLEALVTDLTFYYGDTWSVQIEQLPATLKYVEKLEKLIAEDPILLISHSYVSYQCNVSGGQKIKTILSRLFELPEEESTGINFFEFPNISNIKEFKGLYCERMNKLNLSDNQKCDLVEEAKSVFLMTMVILQASIIELERKEFHDDSKESISPEVRTTIAKLYKNGYHLRQSNSSEKISNESSFHNE